MWSGAASFDPPALLSATARLRSRTAKGEDERQQGLSGGLLNHEGECG